MATTVSALLARVDEAVDRATEAAIAGQGFSLDKRTYRQGFRELHAVYEKVVQAREDIKARADAVQPGRVSDQIAGLSECATITRNTVTQPEAGSLVTALAAVEAKIATLLNAMHASYAAYQRTDQESSFNLISGAAAP